MKTYTHSKYSMPSGNVMSRNRVGVSQLIILLIPGYEEGFWAKFCGVTC